MTVPEYIIALSLYILLAIQSKNIEMVWWYLVLKEYSRQNGYTVLYLMHDLQVGAV